MAKTVVALEITEECVRAIEVTTGRAQSVVALGEVPLPAGAAKDSEVLDADAVAVALRQLWSQTGIKSRKVVLGIGSRRVLVREFSTPTMSLELIKASLPYQVQDLLPVPANQAVLDFYPVAESAGQVHGLLVAAVSETVEELLAAVRRAKLTVTRVDLTPFGLARVQRAVAAPGETSAIIYLGEHTSYVVVATDGVPDFVRVIPADIVAPGLALAQIVEPEPELALVGGGSTRGRSSSRAAGGGAESVVADLVGRIRSTLAFYGGRPTSARIGSVHVTGPGAGMPEISARLEDAIDVPWKRVDLDTMATLGLKIHVTAESARNLVSTVGVVLGEEN
ncbi:pilus assembly protein PilM [Microbacterium aoyamense]|nr:pilus assembly protein PilM [Microbacterium aoyamense]